MVKVWTERQLIDLGLGLIDCISGGDGQNPKVTEISVTYSGLHLAALRSVAKALREAGIPLEKVPQSVTTYT